MSELILGAVIDLGFSQARYRAWQLLLLPDSAQVLQISAAYLQCNGGALTALTPVAFSRAPVNAAALSVLNDGDEQSFARFEGSEPVGVVWTSPQPVLANGAMIRTMGGEVLRAASLLHGGAWASGFTSRYTQGLQMKLQQGVQENEYGFYEAGLAFIEPEQSDMDYMTPGGPGYLEFRVTTEHFPQPGFPEYKPQYAQVQLHRLNDGKVIQTKWSNDITGEGIFENVDPSYAYAITATHPEHAYQALIASNVRAKVD